MATDELIAGAIIAASAVFLSLTGISLKLLSKIAETAILKKYVLEQEYEFEIEKK